MIARKGVVVKCIFGHTLVRILSKLGCPNFSMIYRLCQISSLLCSKIVTPRDRRDLLFRDPLVLVVPSLCLGHYREHSGL